MSVTPARRANTQVCDAAPIRSSLSDDSAVQWITLSGCRICEAQHAKLNDIDLVSMTWTVPSRATQRLP